MKLAPGYEVSHSLMFELFNIFPWVGHFSRSMDPPFILQRVHSSSLIRHPQSKLSLSKETVFFSRPALHPVLSTINAQARLYLSKITYSKPTYIWSFDLSVRVYPATPRGNHQIPRVWDGWKKPIKGPNLNVLWGNAYWRLLIHGGKMWVFFLPGLITIVYSKVLT